MAGKALITGITGQDGSYLAELLLDKGYEVFGIVRRSSTETIERIEHIKDKVTFLQADLLDQASLTKALEEAAPDEIYNLACPASPVHYQTDPVQTTKTSVHGAINMLGLAKRVRARLFQASTSEVYGDPEVHPQKESYWGSVNPIGPRGVYDEAKRFAEALSMAYHRYHGVDVRIARIFNTFGPRMRRNDGRVVSNFIIQALKGDPLTIQGEGTQTRASATATTRSPG